MVERRVVDPMTLVQFQYPVPRMVTMNDKFGYVVNLRTHHNVVVTQWNIHSFDRRSIINSIWDMIIDGTRDFPYGEDFIPHSFTRYPPLQ